MDNLRERIPPFPLPPNKLKLLNWIAGPGDLFLLFLVMLPAIFPLLRDGFPQTADGNLHLLRLVLLNEQIKQGILLPQWTPQLFLGYGYPVFHFYASATYYLGLLLHWLGLNIAQALIGVFICLTLFGGIGMRWLAYDIFSIDQTKIARWPAFLAAVAYMYGPYLLTNIYIRGAVAELGAQALLPWIFFSFRRLFRAADPAPYLLPAALSLGALAFTHNISLLFIPPVLLLYLLLLWGRTDVNRRSRLKWAFAAGGTAVALSAFFWLPLLVERQYLADTAFSQSAQLISEHFWTWPNFLDRSIRFIYDTNPPFQLGLWQLILAMAGFTLAWRRDGEWLFWLGLAVVSSLGISSLARAWWTTNEILLIAQFPWRLLTLVTPALALLTGGLLTRLKSQPVRLLVCLLFVGTILYTQIPKQIWTITTNPDQIELTPTNVTAYEVEVGALGTSSTQEFLPRWVRTITLTESPLTSPALSEISLRRAANLEMQVEVVAAEPTPLRWTNFYFPGWHVTLEDGTVLKPYPSTGLGLLTVDVPMGHHQLTLSWQPTNIQRLGAGITLVSSIILALFLFRQRSLQRWTAVPLLFALLAGLLLWGHIPEGMAVTTPVEANITRELSLLGYQAEQTRPGTLNLQVYWYAKETPAMFNPVWLLEDQQGTVVSRTQQQPYLGAIAAQDWPAGSLVDDVYTVFYPPQLSGKHHLYLSANGDLPRYIGEIDLSANKNLDSNMPETADLSIQFGDYFLFGKEHLTVNGRSPNSDTLAIVEPGDRLEYQLQWQLAEQPPLNFNASLQLTDANWQVLTQKDQILGAPFNFPQLWNPYQTIKDSYRLQIPTNTPNGLYWPRLAVYNYANGERLPVAADDITIGDLHTLPPVKVIGHGRAHPQTNLKANFGDMAELLGYDLSLPKSTLQAGDTFTLTLIYRSNSPVPIDYQQFIHLRNVELGMAGQADKTPQEGNNPTSVWQSGEIIEDTTSLTISSETQPGIYTLFVGFYNPQDGVRLPATNDEGQPLVDNQLMLLQIEVVSSP